MGIFGTYGAFQGLGKPSIKLEFEDNESLVNFSKRMQEGEAAPVRWSQEEEMFVPVEGVELSENAFRNLFNKPEKFRHINYTDIDNDFPEYIYVNYPNTLRKAFKVKTPLKGGEKFVYVFADLEHLKYDNSTNQDREDIIGLLKPTLEDPDIVFESDGENNFVKAFKSNSGQFIIFSFIPTVKGKNGFMKTQFIKDFGKIYKKYKKDGCKLKYTHPPINFNGSLGELNEQPIYFVELRLPCADKVSNNISDRQIFNENSLGAPGDVYLVTDTRKKPRKELDNVTLLKKYDIRKLTGEELAKMQKEDPLLYEQIKSDINEAKVTPIKDASKDADELVAVWSKKFRPVRGFDEQKSIASARAMKEVRDEITQYLVDEVNAGNYEYVRKLANLLGYKYIHNARIAETHSVIEQFATITPTLPEGWQISSAVPKYLPKLPKGFVYIDNGKDGFEYQHKIMPAKKGLGRTANPAIYNNNDIMECRGFVPTYTILDDYSSFFEQAKTHTEFAGFGLDDTLKLITDICRKHWKDCARIAQHLKGDCKLQSAFNLWHWMRYNIRYEYDREGREEVRTPLRVWADRMRGVDCDCLSVFAYCVLKCMGYNPAFELVAFRNKPQYSHIFINLDGIVVDRVWFIFNSRPPMVTKSTIYRINDINDLGKLF